MENLDQLLDIEKGAIVLSKHINPFTKGAQQAASGFTLIELMVTIALLSLLMSLALPSFNRWIRNTQVRTVAEALQNGVRVAQAEAVRRNRQVVFSFTNAQPALGAAAVANGKSWSIQTVAQFSDTAGEFIQGGAFADVASGVLISGGPVAICFNSNGRLVAKDSDTKTGVPGATCDINGVKYDVSTSGSDRALRVTVAFRGQVRLCDPKRALSDFPDGCPP